MTHPLADRMAALETEELMEIVVSRSQDYTQEAIEAARSELEARNVTGDEIAHAGDGGPTRSENPGPSGLGGWLAFFGFVQLLGAVRLTISVLQLATETGGRIEKSVTVLVLSVLAIAAWYVAVLYFKKDRLFPKVAITVLGISGALGVVVSLVAGSFLMATLSLMGPLLWITYLSTSKRVRNTFVARKLQSASATCPECGASLWLCDDELAARRFQCPSCSREIVLPDQP